MTEEYGEKDEARGAFWTSIVSLIAGIVIVMVFAAWMVFDALPGTGQ